MTEPLRTPVAVALRTLGCKVNRVESEELAAALIGSGVRIVDEDEARLVVVNTCTVTGEADAKARKAVRQALAAAGEPVVVVTGCLAALDRDGLSALGERVVVEADKARLAARVRELLALDAAAPAPVPAAPARDGAAFRTRVAIKVEDGCDNFCAYCIVPHARGVPRATPLAEVVARAAALVSAGTREVVLTGINIGRYRDAAAGADLGALVSVIAETGVERIRLSSVEPPDLTHDFLATLAATPAVCAHLHVPLQSGANAVLSAMGRRYTSAEFAERIAAAREALPGLAVTTDLIAGFPGETADDHARTLAFVESLGFSKLHVFRYSVRTGTPAAELPQLDPAIRAARAAELREVGERTQRAFAEAAVSRVADVLVECVADGMAEGTSREYLRVRVPASSARVGDILPARLVRVEADGTVFGESA